jgi:hypothetical protein
MGLIFTTSGASSSADFESGNKNKTGNVRINVTLRHVCVTIAAVKKQYYIF